MKERAAAKTVSAVFPRLECVKIELAFSDSERQAPADQTHAAHPSAPAYFRYPCPHADCDGFFDLSEEVATAAKRGQDDARGSVDCAGTRFMGVARGPCKVRADYAITITRT